MNKPERVSVFWGEHPWDVVRNNSLINQFLESDCTVFAKMDTDQWYPRNYLEVMLPLAAKHDVIGPLIYDRGLTTRFMPLCPNPKEENSTPFSPPEMMYDGKQGVVEVPYLHTNCFYSREVLESLSPPYYEANLSENGLVRTNHVDYTFMKKITDKGFKIFINFNMVVAHIAQIAVTREFYERYNRIS